MTAFRIEHDELGKAAGQAARIAGKGSPPYNALRIAVEGDKATLSAATFDTSIAVTVAVAGGQAGVVAVPAKGLVDAVRSLRAGAVEVAYDDAKALRLVSGASVAVVPTVDARDVPEGPTMGDGALIDRAALVAMLGRVLPAAGHDTNRPIITGVLFEAVDGRLRLVATDSYRLAYGDTVCPWDGDALVPATALAEVVRLDGDGPLALERTDDAITFGVGSTVLRSRLIEGEFPNYRQLIPANQPYRLEASTEELAEMVKRIGQGDDSGPQRWALADDVSQLSSRRSDGGERRDELAVEWDGPEFGVAFNSDFMGDALEGCGTARVSIGMTDALKPVLIAGIGDTTWATLIMPVRV